MALDFHDQVSATRTATHAAAGQARKKAHQTADVARAVDVHEPAQAAKAIANRAAKQAAKVTARAAGRKPKRAARRGLRVILVAVVAGGLLALAFAAYRRMRATSSGTLTNSSFDRSDPAGNREDAEPDARSETDANGAAPTATTPTAKSTFPSND
jgi:hypothetical protein